MAEYKAKYISAPFYSNCLIEAVKAKFKYPLRVKITVVGRSEAGCPHFLWSDRKYDLDFESVRPLHGLEFLWFMGCIRQRNLGFNERYKKMMQERWRNNGK